MRRLWLIWAGVLVTAFPAWARVDVESCHLYFDALAGATEGRPSPLIQLSPQQLDFFRNDLLPIVGKRLLAKSFDEHRVFTVKGDTVTVSGFGEGNDLRFRFIDNAKAEPSIQWDRLGNRILVVPKGFNFKKLPRDGADIIKRFLMGHTLHPQIDYKGDQKVASPERKALGELPLFLREVQHEGRDAVRQAAKNGDKAFLYVSPTGTGKTEILKSVLETQLERGRKGEIPSLHVLTAHTDALVKQLFSDMKEIPQTGFEFIRWGGAEGQKGASLEKLLDAVEAAKKRGNQVVLITTTHSLINSLKKDGPAKDSLELDAIVQGKTKVEFDPTYIGLLKEQLGTVAIDEAHHAGAPNTHEMLKQLLSGDSKAFLFGPTATPTHREVELARDLFGDNDYWSYLDTPESYRDRKNRDPRSIADVITQLKEAIQRGELNAFDPIFLNPENFKKLTGRELFTNALGEGRFVIDPEMYPAVIKLLKPTLKNHDQGFIAVRTTHEAERFTEALKQEYGDVPIDKMANGKDVPKQRFAYLHSDMDPDAKAAVMAAFQRGDIKFLITVNMLDEGIDVPKMSLYVDLTRSTDPKQLLQRLGRVLRLFPGKDRTRNKKGPHVQMISFQDVKDQSTADLLMKLDAMNESKDTKSQDDDEDGKEQGKDDEDEGAPPEVLNPNTGPVSLQWSTTQLAKLKKFFTQDTAGLGKAQAEADQVTQALSKARPQELSILHSPSPSLLKAINFIAARDDMSTARAGRAGFFDRLANNSAHTEDLVRTYQQHRAEIFEKIKDPAALAEVFHQINANTRGPLSNDSLTKDQQRISAEALSAVTRGDIRFLTEFYDRSTTRILDHSGVESRVNNLLADPIAVERVASEFYRLYNRVPDPEAKGFEGVLYEAIRNKISDPEKQLAHNVDMMVDLIAQREGIALAHVEPPKTPKQEPAPRSSSPQPHEDVPYEPTPALRPALSAKLQAIVSARLQSLGDKWSPEKERLTQLKDQLTNLSTFRELLADAEHAGSKSDANEARKELRELEQKILDLENVRLLTHQTKDFEKPNEVTIKLSGKKVGSGVLTDRYLAYAKARGWKWTAPEVTVKGYVQENSVTFHGPGVAEFFAREAGVVHAVVVIESEGAKKGSPVTADITMSLASDRRVAPRQIQHRRKWALQGTFNDTRVPTRESFNLDTLADFHTELQLQTFQHFLETNP